MNSTFKPAFFLISGRAVGVAAAFLIPVVLVRIFSQAEFGIYKQLFVIYATLFGIAQIGMAESLFYFLPRNSKEGGRFAANSLLVLVAAGVACLLLLTASAPAINAWADSGSLTAPIVLLGVYLLFTMASALLEIVLISRQRYLMAALSYAGSDLLRTACFLLPILLMPRLEALLLGGVIFASLRLLATIFYLKREYGQQLRLDALALRLQLAYALPFAMAVLIEILQANLHHYAVFSRFDPATFAIYAVGCLQIPLVDLIGSSAANVMMVKMSEARISEGPRAVIDLWNDTTRKMALIFFPLVALMLLNAREIIVLLFTENYLASIPIFMLWTLAVLGSVIQVDSVLRVYAETRFIFMLNMVRLLLVLALIFPFLSLFHLQGAVLVSLLATFAGKGLGLARVKSVMQVGLTHLLPWRHLAAITFASAAAALPALLVKSGPAMPIPAALAASGLIYAAAYLGLLVSFGMLDTSGLHRFLWRIRESLCAE